MADLTGTKFGRLTVVGRDEGIYWLCVCECGKTTSSRSDHLTGGRTRSCGCLRDEMAARIGANNRLHGQAKGRRAGVEATPEYTAWASMKTRCLNSKIRNWHRYGGRGISVCPEWINDFEAFRACVGPRPSAQHSLDRYPNNDGNYEPGNVRWATPKEQQNNRGNNRAKVAA